MWFIVKIVNMSTEFDWFMVTMPVFALIVWAIVIVGSMEKQPKFLDGAIAKKLFGLVFIGFFGVGVVVSLFYMLLRFWELLGNYWSSFPSPIFWRIFSLVFILGKPCSQLYLNCFSVFDFTPLSRFFFYSKFPSNTHGAAWQFQPILLHSNSVVDLKKFFKLFFGFCVSDQSAWLMSCYYV